MSFRLKTVLGIAAIEIVLLALLIVSGLHYLKSSNEAQLVGRAITTARLFSTMTSDSVVALDLATLDVLVEETSKNPGIAYLRVRHANGTTLSERGDADALRSPFSEDHDFESATSDQRYDVAYPIEVAGQLFGQVELGLRTDTLRQVVSEATRWMLTVAGFEVILVAIFGYLLGRILTRQLISLREGAREVATGNVGHTIPVLGSDELAETARSFNSMSEALSRRTAELQAAKERAESANEAKLRFLAIISHEIRTPINGVLGIFTMLEDSKLTPHQEKLVRTGQDSSKSLLQIVNDVLDFSKMDVGKLDLEISNFELRSVIDSVLEINSVVARSGVSLRMEIDKSVANEFSGDPGRIRQVLMNLVGNAVKFTSEGSITVRANLEARQDDKSVIYFEVIDTGTGIPDEYMDELFADFTTVRPPHSSHRSGAGLGLAICRKLVSLMDGDIGCESVVGKGSNFWFRLTLAGPKPELAPSLPGTTSDRIRSIRGKTRRPSDIHILLAEDNAANAMVATHMLESAGYRVLAVADGSEAVKAAESVPLDLIIMDVGMPEMDGIEATRRIRSLQDIKRANTPIVAMTAHVLEEDRERILDSGLDDYLAKPTAKADLIAMVERWTGAPSALAKKSNERLETAHPESFDPAAINTLGETTDFSALPSLINTFIEDSGERCRSMIEAGENGDLEHLKNQAHALKSSAISFGATELHRLASEIEESVTKGDHKTAIELARRVEVARSSVVEQLDRILQKL